MGISNSFIANAKYFSPLIFNVSTVQDNAIRRKYHLLEIHCVGVKVTVICRQGFIDEKNKNFNFRRDFIKCIKCTRTMSKQYVLMEFESKWNNEEKVRSIICTCKIQNAMSFNLLLNVYTIATNIEYHSHLLSKMHISRLALTFRLHSMFSRWIEFQAIWLAFRSFVEYCCQSWKSIENIRR